MLCIPGCAWRDTRTSSDLPKTSEIASDLYGAVWGIKGL